MERLCYATEFEIEGWKKIVPLTKILERYTNVQFSNENAIFKLEMDHFYALSEHTRSSLENITCRRKYHDHQKFVDNNKFVNEFKDTTIRKSEIYRHFVKSKQALVIYVSQQTPINENCDRRSIPTGNHCVVATGIEEWNGVECLVLDNTGRNKEENYIPVDFPLFEHVYNKIIEIKKINNPDKQSRSLNNLGFPLAQQKFQEVKKFEKAKHFKATHGEEWFNMKKDGDYEYQMFFVKGSQPIHKLEFKS